jgi:hypothetical protein
MNGAEQMSLMKGTSMRALLAAALLCGTAVPAGAQAFSSAATSLAQYSTAGHSIVA